MEGTRPLRGQP